MSAGTGCCFGAGTALPIDTWSNDVVCDVSVDQHEERIHGDVIRDFRGLEYDSVGAGFELVHFAIQSFTIFSMVTSGRKRSDFDRLFEWDFPFGSFFIRFQLAAFDLQCDLLSAGC
ncbi:hypothetical protein LBMAG46_02500 [Planctomycetia bacterium]|nr:hypothetical protein LBMAG46_02500 [Planctomycetia bacterium]